MTRHDAEVKVEAAEKLFEVEPGRHNKYQVENIVSHTQKVPVLQDLLLFDDRGCEKLR